MTDPPGDQFGFEPGLNRRIRSSLAGWGSDELRQFAVESLRELRSSGVRSAADAVELLRDGRSRTAWADAAMLLELGARRGAARAVSQALSEARDPILRAYCITVLGALAGPVARRTLLELVVQPGSTNERFATVSSLGMFFGDPGVVPGLAYFLSSATEEAATRAQAARSLGNIGLDAAKGPLVTALRDTSSEVRDAASEALKDIGGSAQQGSATPPNEGRSE